MIRPATESDIPAITELAFTSGLFPETEVDTVQALMAEYFARTRDGGHACLLDDGDGGEEKPVGVAYYQPVPATDRTWTLLMIAVRMDRQGQGRGGALLRQVEAELGGRGQRLLLVETSGIPDFELTRTFYVKSGYTEQARVPDYYEDGDDMVLFHKNLIKAQS
ncbi:ribosomal protein S18 acetylase RimI-like enzyme [Nakamurella sp. UYEF19]|uniref:GNAT family N-acetyltransferase n=1 Tax=Nakamurella sp. UYEF19 TaxID=1756392 RepID=UPI003399C648